MEIIDYLILATYIILSIIIALYYSKRSGKSTDEFFLSGRNLPWYFAGISLAATTFAADTPLAVTELVAKNGISGNWVWWNFAFGGMLTVFFFARLWRRAGIMTEAEFSEIRYSGKPAKFLRGFRAVYLGLFMNVIIIGWVNKAMVSILTGLFSVSETQAIIYVFVCMLLVAAYSAMSGLWGVVVTDAFQFFLAMTGAIILAVLVLDSPEVGGMIGLQEKLPDFIFNFFPSVGNSAETFGSALSLSVLAFLAYIGLQWWASWYPGAEPGGGGYAAQRMMSAKDEKHSLLAVLLFQVLHYAARPWPWIIVGLASLVLYPELTTENARMGYIFAMRDFLPTGLKGLLVAAFFAAYMSTIATHLNWGASYLMNDVYKRFIVKTKSDKHYVSASRIITVLLMIISIFVTLLITRISGAWEFILQCGAGVGLVLILRWYWWRINAWSEISAMIAPFLLLPITIQLGIIFPENLYFLVAGTSIIWIAVTFLTKPEPDFKLMEFYSIIRPGGKLWKPIQLKLGIENEEGTNLLYMLFAWLFGVLLVYSMMFGIGSLILNHITASLIYGITSLIAIFGVYYFLNKEGWSKILK